MKIHAFLDIDGVILGHSLGKNFPRPSLAVRNALREFMEAGHRITLCTGRGAFATQGLIEELELPGPHIADGGGVIFDPLGAGFLRVLSIPSDLLQAPFDCLQSEGIYTALIGSDCYYVQRGADESKASKQEEIVSQSPIWVDSLQDILLKVEVNRLFFCVASEEERLALHEKITPFEKDLELTWTSNPYALPHLYGWFTRKGVSKGEALQYLRDSYPSEDHLTLGVGDNGNDWDFLQHCDRKGIMGNASDSLKNIARNEIKQNDILWLPDVEEDGLVTLLKDLSEGNGALV